MTSKLCDNRIFILPEAMGMCFFKSLNATLAGDRGHEYSVARTFSLLIIPRLNKTESTIVTFRLDFFVFEGSPFLDLSEVYKLLRMRYIDFAVIGVNSSPGLIRIGMDERRMPIQTHHVSQI